VLVVDASVTVTVCASAGDFDVVADDELVAPALMWSEALSALHEGAWRGEIGATLAARARGRLEEAPVQARSYPRMGADAWAIADELGWARTYDAEYLALARHLGCRLVTLNGRLRRGAGRTGLVVSLDEL
jgi:predicted nucleic acid-binding protein